MVRALEQEQESYRSKLFHFKGMFENTGRHTKSLSIESATKLDPSEEDAVSSSSSSSSSSKSQGSNPIQNSIQNSDKGTRPRIISKEEIAAREANEKLMQEMEQMKERFAKLLLGEDMSGGGKGVSSALALSNAFTNLAAAVFGEQKRLEPMSPERKSRWRKEIDWLLSVTDYIVEMVPSQQKSKDGSTMEIMTTRQRTDLHMNIPALRKLDTMLNDCLDNFKGQNEFYYVKKEEGDADKDGKTDDKWWLPTPKVPVDGLSDVARKFLQYQKDCVTQVLKAAMAINAQTLSEMEIPESYIESLPKNGRASLGDTIYRSITDDYFDPDQLLGTMDLSSEHKILDLKNKIEASIVIWKRKMNQKDSKSAWGSAVSMEKRELFEERAETILLFLKHRFPGIPQSALDISKIQFNKDVGQAVLESYSRILESLAYTVLSRIEDVLNADSQNQNSSQVGKKNNMKNTIPKPEKPLTPKEEVVVTEKGGAEEIPNSMTLSDFMGWLGDSDMKKDPSIVPDELDNEIDSGKPIKLSNIVTDKKASYLENLGGVRSPTCRQ
ncbi:putative PRONE domain-containing protein [Lupinus albus]|uniref:Putative PRONE domain-containing protein n=1 Tax=Lupinus albus TaxID=3870 RepID=A0A6A4R6R1_LUPAL|nr:putative PRONE domain-containing protein [Lupinus albus]